VAHGHVVQDIAALYCEPVTGQAFKGGRRCERARAHDGHIVRYGVRRGKIRHRIAFWRIVHAHQHVDLAVGQRLSHLVPGPQAEVNLQAQGIGDGPREIDIVAGGHAVLVQVLKGRIPVVATHRDAATPREGQGAEPARAELAEGAIGHHQGETLIEQRQQLGVTFTHSKTELLPIVRERRLHHPQIGEPGIRNGAQGYQLLCQHRIELSPGQPGERLIDRIDDAHLDAALLALQELFRIAIPHHRHSAPSEVLQRLDVRILLAHHQGAVHREVREGEIIHLLSLRRASQDGQHLDLALLEPGADLWPRAHPDGHLPAHGPQGGTQEFHGQAGRLVAFGDGKGRIVRLAGGQNGCRWRGRLLRAGRPGSPERDRQEQNQGPQ